MGRVIQTLIGRAEDLAYVRRAVVQGSSCSIVGTSNLGKSALLRHLCATSDPGTYVYVDCNQMADRSYRAFFAAAWRALAAQLENEHLDAESLGRVRRWSTLVIHASSPLAAQSAFEDGLAFVQEHLALPLVLCFDEFDQVYQQCEPQTFLNLRALHDRYSPDLVYVTATERELGRLTATREQGEFLELVSSHVRFLSFWNLDDTRRFCMSIADREEFVFEQADYAFIFEQAGGHPGLTLAVCEALGAATLAPPRGARSGRSIRQLVASDLISDGKVRAECSKIWDDLEPDERDALADLSRADLAPSLWRSLQARCILKGDPEHPQFFSPLFAAFVGEQQPRARPNGRGVYVDSAAGSVRVNGKEVEPLSELEYKLLLFLYGRRDQVCDKYAIVEGVWGQNYIDEVDDTRIEKLVSRVRQKIEPDPSNPRYLLSLRGRGYKLAR